MGEGRERNRTLVKGAELRDEVSRGWGAEERCAVALEFKPSKAVPACWVACTETVKARDVLCSGG